MPARGKTCQVVWSRLGLVRGVRSDRHRGIGRELSPRADVAWYAGAGHGVREVTGTVAWWRLYRRAATVRGMQVPVTFRVRRDRHRGMLEVVSPCGDVVSGAGAGHSGRDAAQTFLTEALIAGRLVSVKSATKPGRVQPRPSER